MFALSDARDYSFLKVPYLEREEEITDQSNFAPAYKNGGQTGEKRGKYLSLRFPNMVKVNIHEH